MVKRTLVLGTHNAKKLVELRLLLPEDKIQLSSLSELADAIDVEETGDTFAENAALKATQQALHLRRWVLAEDSGLTVDALGGKPGVLSARYAGVHGQDEANNDKLLAALEGVEDRGAAFHCVATFVAPGDAPLVAAGEWRGTILHERQGDGGFGYDPLFYVPECGCSSAELAPDEKNARSHRGQALRKLVALLEQKYA